MQSKRTNADKQSMPGRRESDDSTARSPSPKKMRRSAAFSKNGPPQMPLGLHLEPKVQVVAFRAHQALPVGRAQQYRYGPQPFSRYWFKEFKALTNTAGD